MQQLINLYTADFRPTRQWLTPQHCLWAWAAILVIGLLAAGGLKWRGQELLRTATALEAQVQAEQDGLSADTTRLAQHLPSATLTLELERSAAEETAKQELLAALESGALVGRQGYTPVLTSLARNPLPGLWLTGIEISGSDVNLTGMARYAELIPAYVKTLVNDADFGARNYASLNIHATEQGALSFELRGQRGAGGATP